MDKCKVTALCNQKGGVGKTTTTLNLGVGLAGQGKRVLLIDADPQASLTIALGWNRPDELPVTLSDIMQDIIDENAIPKGHGILKHVEGVDLLPGSIDLSGMELRLMSIMSREKVLQEYIDAMRPYYDHILIDCMPSFGMLTLNALAAADRVIIPTQPTYLSIKGLDMLTHTIAKVKRQINPSLNIDGILFTMVDNRTNEAKEIMASLKEHYGGKLRVFQTEIPFSVRAAETSAKGKSIYAHDRNGKVAAAYRALTKEVCSLGKNERSRADAVR